MNKLDCPFRTIPGENSHCILDECALYSLDKDVEDESGCVFQQIAKSLQKIAKGNL
jgi:hypothetical protein